MGFRTGALRIGVLAAGGICAALGQSDPLISIPAPPPSDYKIYSDFFHSVQNPAYCNPRSPANSVSCVQRSLKPSGPDDVPYLPQLDGLTEREANDVRAIAADCEQRLNAVGSDHPHLAWEALMESIETGDDTSTKVEQMVRDDQAQRERIVLAHQQVLKADLGDARFQELDARLRGRESAKPLSGRR